VPDTRYAKSTDGTHVAYQVDGDGPVDLIQVPGFVSNVEVYTQVPAYEIEARRFGAFARRIRIDKRGTGQSDRNAAMSSLEERMDDVRAVMDAVGSERAFLYGISEGGPMCALFAATYPERTLGLVLLGSFARLVPDGVGDDAVTPLLVHMEEHWGDGTSLRSYVPAYAAAHPEMLSFLAQYERQSASPGAARDILKLAAQIDVRPILASIDVPALVVHTTGDPMIPIADGRYLAEHIPGSRMRELPFADHILLEESELEVLLDEIEEFVTGTRPVHDLTPDRILATVLFTDIVESTARAADLGDAKWKQTLDRHDEITSKLVERHRGRVVKTTGDGVLATFDGPARAVQCGLAAREAVRPLGIDIRAGVHTGECEQRGDDLGGIAVHIGSRVAGLAEPGEVLVSRTVKDLVAGSGLHFEDRGEHTLKGVPDRWQVYAAAS
jgi:class 3 adenylate cyclase